MKKIIILSHDGGEFGNQIWNHINISAYAIEKDIALYNDSLYEYIRSFPDLNKSFISHIFSMLFPCTSIFRRNMLHVKIVRKFHKIFCILIQGFHNEEIIYSNICGPITSLPPSEICKGLNLSSYESGQVIYFAGVSGGVFRNPVGIIKHAGVIRKQLRPDMIIEKRIEKIFKPLKEEFTHFIGVHIRNTDYKKFKDGKYHIEPQRVRSIIDEYIKGFNLNIQKTIFIITSDEYIQSDLFDDLNIVVGNHDPVTECFLLSRCDVILGADSTFGHLASYLGDIPHIIFKKEDMDWDYYRDQKKYFVNKYFTMMNSDSYNGLAK